MADSGGSISQIIGICRDITNQVGKAKFNKIRLRDLSRRCTALSEYCQTSEALQRNVFFNGLLGTVTDCKEYVMTTRSRSFVVYFLTGDSIADDYEKLVQMLDQWFSYIKDNPEAKLPSTTETTDTEKEENSKIEKVINDSNRHLASATKLYNAEFIGESMERSVVLRPDDYYIGHYVEDFMFGVIKEGLEKNRYQVTIREIKKEIDGKTLSIIKQGTLLTWYLGDCEYILRTRGLIHKNGIWYIVANHTKYGSLNRHLKHYPLETENKIKIASKIATGLSYMHRAGIIHKDIRSHNIALDTDFTPKITGFELCRQALADTIQVNTQEFTRKWWPPERKDGKGCTKATDVYSFGVLMYELSIGKTEFEDIDLNNEYLPVHPDYDKLLGDCLKPNPDDRPNVEEIVKRLTRLEVTECHN